MQETLSPDEPAAGVYTVPELAARLREDPVVVQTTMGNGHRDQVDAHLSELAARFDVPVFVAMVNEPAGLNTDDPDGELAALLRAELDQDGYYFVAVGGRIERESWTGYGEGLPGSWEVREANPASASYEQLDRVQSMAGRFAETLATLDNDVEALPADTLSTYREGTVWSSPRESWLEEHTPPTPGTYGVALTSVALSLTLGVLIVLRLLHHWGTGEQAVPAARRGARSRTRGQVRSRDRHQVTQRRLPGVRDAIEPSGPAVLNAVRRELRHLDRRGDEVRRRPEPPSPEALRLADRSRASAEALLEALPHDPARITPGSRDLLDAVGAWVLLRIARDALDEPGPPYTPCFLNPCHGRGGHRATIGFGAGDVEVPACRNCRDLDAPGHTADPLLVQDWRGEKPYYQARSVWAETGFGAFADELWREVDADRGVR